MVYQALAYMDCKLNHNLTLKDKNFMSIEKLKKRIYKKTYMEDL